MPEIPRRFLRRTWVRRALPAGVAAVLVMAGTAVTRANANASPVDTYRTGTVTTGSVEQRLNLTGAVRQVDQMNQSFAVAGTVTTLRVSVGDTVTTGQALAAISPLPLHRAVTAAQASLAKAKATLESDQTSTAANGTGGTGGTTNAAAVTPAPTATPTTSPRVASPSGRSGPGAGQTLAQAQLRVTNAQKAITADLGQASAALAQCAPFFPAAPAPSGTRPTTSPTSPVTPAPTMSGPRATTGPTPTSTATAPATPSAAAISACVGALRTVPTQQQIQRDQRALTRSQTDLMTAVTLAVMTTGTAKTSGTTTAAGQSATSHPSTSGSTTAQSSSAGQPATTQSLTSRSSGGLSATSQSSGGLSAGSGQSGASRVVSDQSAVTSAQSALNSAQADLTSATLKSSISGTVGSITLVNGASSAGKSIVIVGAGAVEVTVNVPLASVGSIRMGQKANVTPQGATSSAPGAVTSVSLLPSTSTSGGSPGKATTQTTGTATGTGSATSSSPVYPVVVLVPDALPALASGSRADVSLLVGTAAMVLTVPNSALTPLSAGQAIALTYKDGVTTRALVKTGYTGTLFTQVTSGLTAGQHVVLADLSTALPTNTTNSRRFGVGGASGGGLGGAGLGGAGLGGAGLGGPGPGGGGPGLGGGGFPARG